MNFARRLRLFIFGIILGGMVVWAMLIRGRNFPAWTPQGRILEALSEHPVIIRPQARCKMECNGIHEKDVLNIINTATVLFSESEIRGREIPEYVLAGKTLDGREIKMKFMSEPEENFLLDLIPTPSAPKICNCNPE